MTTSQQSAPTTGCLQPLLDLAVQLDRALTAAEQAARPDPELMAAVQRITRPAKTPAA